MVALEKVRSSFLELRTGLDGLTVGYGEFKDALVVALFRRTLGMKGNILVYGPPGVAKTHTIKGSVNLIGQLNGGLVGHDGAAGYVRVQGRSDLTPEDFISRRVAEYNEEGKLFFIDKLLAIERLRADNGSLLPGVFQFDELDKTPGRAVFGLLEVMEEQQVTLPSTGLSIGLNTCVVAAANTKKFDAQAQAIPRAIQDRFSTVVFLDYLSIDDDLKVLNLVGSGAKRLLPTIQVIDMEAVRVLQEWVAKNGLPISASEAMKRGCVIAVKLTQKEENGFTDFSRYIKTPSGPRGYIDLYQEAMVQALLAGSTVLQPEHCIQVGMRALRGRIEPAPEAELEDKTADTIIAEILQEVFGDMARQTADAPALPEEKDEASEAEESTEEEESEPEEKLEETPKEAETESQETTDAGETEKSSSEPQAGEENSDEKSSDASFEAEEDGSKESSEPKTGTEEKQEQPVFGQAPDQQKQQQRKFLSHFRWQMMQKRSTVRQKSEPRQDAGQKSDNQFSDFSQKAESEKSDEALEKESAASESQQEPSETSQEAKEDKKAGKEAEKKGTDKVGQATSETSEDVHGGENASGEVEDSPNTKQDGRQQDAQESQSQSGESQKDSGSQQPGQRGDQPGSQSGESGQGGSDGESSNGPSGQSGEGGAGGSQSDGKGSSGADGDPTQLQQGGAGGGSPRTGSDAPERAREVVDIEVLAQLLAQKYASKFLKTKKGLETGTEIAQKLREAGEQKFDLRAEDGSLEAKVRGEKAIVEAKSEAMEKLQKTEDENEPGQETGAGDRGAAVAGKGESFPMMEVSNLPNELRSIMPALRELNAAGQIEKLQQWTQTPPEQRSRLSVEYKLLKGIAHLNALKAMRQFEEQTDGEQTTSHAGGRTDFLQGYRPDLPMNEERTVMNALESGGVLDDQSYVHELRVTTDAPHFVFVIDTSGSMGKGKRMASALASATAVCLHYGPRGATFGVLQFCNNPNVGCRPPESDTDRVIDAILMCSPSGGTSYAPALELAFQLALPNTTVLCFGDFEDSSKLSNEALGLKKQKGIKVIGIIADQGHPDYAAELCDEVNLVAMEDPTAVALVALEAAKPG